ncbi:MAG: YbaL family putative K(+) efflux transporter [Alphaproteobacteria bacterium]
MPHNTEPLITTIVVGLVIAFVLGAVANRLRISPLVGYVLAGVAVGPHTPGFIADQWLASQLAEIGVILLMFGVGLHFSLKDLLSVRAIAIPGALAQIAVATLLGLGVALAMGWPLGAGLVFGVALSVASTVVLMRALDERRLIQTERGRIAVGWLIVEDLAMVLALVLMPAFAALGGKTVEVSGTLMPIEVGAGNVFLTLLITLGKVIAFFAVMLLVGRRVIPWILHYIAHTGSRELFRLSVLAVALGIAFGAAQLFDVSFALGAFFAGMILSESELSQRAAQESLPLRDAFAVLFFVSVGMLIDPAIIVRDPGPVIATVLIIVLGKSVAAFLIVRAFGHPPSTALLISASLAQIGEFSFIFVGLAITLELIPDYGRDYVLTGAIVSILLNPVLFLAVDRFGPRLERAKAAGEGAAAEEVEEESALVPTTLSGHAILVGCGRVGRVICEGLRARGASFLVIEERTEVAERLRAGGVEVLVGNAVEASVLQAANVGGARLLLVAIPNGFEAANIVTAANAMNPAIETVVRVHSDDEVEYLRQRGARHVVLGETETAMGMLAAAFKAAPAEAAAPSPGGEDQLVEPAPESGRSA